MRTIDLLQTGQLTSRLDIAANIRALQISAGAATTDKSNNIRSHLRVGRSFYPLLGDFRHVASVSSRNAGDGHSVLKPDENSGPQLKWRTFWLRLVTRPRQPPGRWQPNSLLIWRVGASRARFLAPSSIHLLERQVIHEDKTRDTQK
jgi:hypothetical protein